MSSSDTPPAAQPQSRRERRRQARDARHPLAAFLIEIATILVFALVISFVVKTFFFRAFYIPSESMEPTLQVDDRIIVNLLAPEVMEVQRGDVVVFEDTRQWWGAGTQIETNTFQDAMIFFGLMPDTSSHFVVKRVVGVGGDEVECCDDQGRILVNGEPIEEPYIFPGDVPSESEFAVTVPQDSVWLLGDHRGNSADSRSHVDEPDMGAVPLEDVIGRSSAVIWPLDHFGDGGTERDPFESVPAP
ncbi:signal peptidase I [Nesterenkonia sandarakina]|uniref:signal peptidase I n=1 Tax=Nesterenkonia sandarakina TaxID=272918 RepID=UPI003CCDB58E